jgi:hypothetical protein
MPMLPATVTAAPQGQVKPAPAQRAGAVPFTRAAQRHTEQGNVVSGIALNNTAPGTFNFSIPSYGYLAGVFLTFSATGGAGGSGVFYEDAPWSAISNIMLQDVNGTPIFGPFDGYSAHLASQLGGYRYLPHNPLITATDTTVAPAPFGQVIQYGPATPTATGNTPLYFATAANGNWNAILPIWLGFGTGGLGFLPNMDASSRYNLQVTLGSGLTGTNGPIFTTQPVTVPTLTLAVEAYCVAQPLAADIYGQQNMTEPPANGTIQYWSRQTFASLSGAQTIQLARVGNVVRNHILIFRDSTTNTRATAETSDMPPVIQFDWDSQPRYIEFLGTSRFKAYQVSGLNAPAGTVFYENTSDPENLAGAERGDYWMTTVGATKLVLRFTPAATVNLQVLTNDFVPSSGEIYSAY